MDHRAGAALAIALPLATAIAAASCHGGGGASSRCDVDLASLRGAGSGAGAVARKIADPADLLQGDSAVGRVGDYLLANDLVRVVVQRPDRHIQPNPFGGAIVDADVVRAPGDPSSDQFGKLAPFYDFGRTVNVDRVEVLDAGDRGAAIVAASGRDDLNDYLNVKSLLPVSLAVDPDVALPLRATTYYVLRPGQRTVHVVSAFCNDGAQPLQLAMGDLIDSGGDVEFFNPRSKTGGFGFVAGLNGISDFPFYAFWGQKSAYAYVPPKPAGNSQVTVSGVVGMLVGSSLEEWLGRTPPPSAFAVPAHGSARFERDFVVGKDLAEVTDVAYSLHGATVRLSGTVTQGGAPVAGARVVAVGSDASAGVATPVPASVAQTGADGTWALRVPPGTYDVSADLRYVARTAPQPVDAQADRAGLALALPASVTMTVQLHEPPATAGASGPPIPGKVVVYCVDAGAAPVTCPFPRGDANTAGNLFRSASYDPWGATVQQVVFVDHTGSAQVELPGSGLYAFVASHGPEWSVSPDTWPASLGTPRAPAEGATIDLELAHVVDTTGWISGDFHVHGVNSPDSPVAYLDRLRTFLAEGVDVLVATDHDYVTDYAPYLAQLDALAAPAGARKASAWLRTLVGDELTTFDYGHWNAFPLARQDSDLVGGAPDWGGGTGASLTPRQIHAALRSLPGGPTRVVQANHPRGTLGWFTHVRLDTGDGRTHACPQQFRMAPLAGCDPAKGQDADTGLFDEGFTAMEIVNDFEEQRIHARMNDWFTFLSRGLVVTATSVSDTHHKVLVAAGYGRSFVNVGSDDPATLDPDRLAAAVNAHHVVASTGAFATLTAGVVGGPQVGIGDLLTASSGSTITFHAHVETASWLPPFQLELHGFDPRRATRYDANGGAQDDVGNATWPGYCASGFQGCDATSGDDAAAFAAAGVQATRTGAALAPGADPRGGHQRWVWDHDFTVTAPSKDGWYVLVVRRDPAHAADDLAPAVNVRNGTDSPSLTILAVTNPIFLDVDGDGRYDAPLGKAARATPWPLRANPRIGLEEARRRSRAIELEK